MMKNTTDTKAWLGASGSLFAKEDIKKQTDAFLAWEDLNNHLLYWPHPMSELEIEEHCGINQPHVNRVFSRLKARVV